MFKAKHKMVIAFLFVVFLTVAFSGLFFARDVKVFYNGNEIRYNVPTRIISNYAMVSLSETLEAIYGRGTVYDPATKTSTFHVNGHVYTHTVGSDILYIDGVPKSYNMPTLIAENRAIVPTKMIADITGCNIQWEPNNYHVLITSPKPVATPVPVVITPPSPTAKPSVPAAIYSAELSKSSVTRGEALTVTIKTNYSANYVWVGDGTDTTPAIFAWEDAAGIKTWVLSYKASKTANITVSASAVQQMSGAVTKTLSLTVSSPTPAPTPVPSATASIYSAYPDRTYIDYGGSVTFTIRTNSATNYVWVEHNGGVTWATYYSSDGSGTKTWAATIYPNDSQQVNIRAGISQSSWNAVYSTQYITVGYGYGYGGYGYITGTPYASPGTIYAGQSTTITVNTNSSANYVWAETGDGSGPIYFNYTYDYYGGKTWTASLTLYSNRTIYIYAGTYSGSRESSANVYVTVQ